MNKKERTKILLVEDDLNLGFVIQDHLRNEGYHCDLEKDGYAGFQKFYTSTYDLCLLDVMLPKKDGFTLAEDIRKINAEVPLLFLTAKSMTEDKIKGFKLGADDYLTKPFSFDELDLRLKAVLKRSKPAEGEKETPRDVFELGHFKFDYNNLALIHEQETKLLTKKEAELLRMLCMHKDQVLAREMALTVVWGSDDYFLGRSMDVFITKLRKYLRLDERVKIMNVHGVGFKLIVDEQPNCQFCRMSEDVFAGLLEKLNHDKNWPRVYLFKFIVPNDNQKLAQAEALFGSEAQVKINQSRTGKYLSISATELMISAEEIIERYKKAGEIEGLISL